MANLVAKSTKQKDYIRQYYSFNILNNIVNNIKIWNLFNPLYFLYVTIINYEYAVKVSKL